MKQDGLTDKEYKDFNEVFLKTLNDLIDCADKHNIDRNSFLKYFCAIFSAFVEVSTFENYKKGGAE